MKKRFLKSIVCSTVIASTLLFGGCGDEEKGNKDVDINAVYDAVKEAYGDDFVPDYEYDSEDIAEIYNITADLYDDIYVNVAKVSFDIDTFVAVKAKEGKADEVEKLLKEYRQSQIDDAMQYPVNAIKIQASEVTRHGDYIFFTCLGVISEESQEAGEDAILEEAKKDNKIAVDKINTFFE